ncbi:MAG: sodium-dependent transporter [Spirochaetales bacterium]|nr:sodium-dependent transporter [Spirochaetales bacterium]
MKQRDQWGSRLGFVLAAVGSAIGLGNIWRFPYQAYNNGGGAFLVPYFIALLTAGIPLIILEFGLGHKMRGAAPSAFARLTTKNKNVNNWEWLGWFQTFLSGVIATYYTVIIGWALSYTFLSFKQSWGDNPTEYFTQTYSQMSGVDAFTASFPIWHIVLAVFAVWAICFAILFSGVKKGVEAANKIFMPLLIVMVLIILFKSITLDGAKNGLNFLFTPNFSKLKDPNV